MEPVGKVVELIQDLKAKITAEGKEEQKIYDKFACWCEKTTAVKAKSIEEAKTSIEKLSEKVLDLKGSTGKLTAEVAGLNKDIAANNQAVKEATQIREKETADYNTAKENLEAAIGALEGAIETLTGAGTLLEKNSAVQKTKLLSVAADIRGVMRVLPSDAFTHKDDKRMVEAFVRDPTSFYNREHAKLGAMQVKGNFGDYNPASTQIQGLLKGMYDAMMSDLESKNAEQAINQKNYEGLMDTKKSELETLTSNLGKKTTQLGEDTKELSESNIERDETEVQLADDTKFFQEAKEACRTKANNWATRTKLRSEELAGIEKAEGILNSDDAKDTFGKANSMLLQRQQKSETNQKNPKKAAAYKALKAVARKQHSLKMGAMAALVETTTEGHFDVVVESIDKMLAELRKEEQDDIDLRDYCQDAENKVENEIEDLEHLISNIDGLIDRLKGKKKELIADIKQTEDDITATEDAMAEALSTRNAENEEFKAALKEDKKAVEILGEALEAMGAFQKNNGFIQKAAKTKKAPEYKDGTMPDDALNEPYGGARSEGGGIESILGYIREDIQNEIKTTTAGEAKAQAQFEQQRSTATKNLNALNTKKVTLETSLADTEEKIADAEEDKETQETSKDNRQKYRDSLKPKCDWMKETFGNRRTKRREEMDGLLAAKASLAGAVALVQKPASFRGQTTPEEKPWIL
jgi:hypothetical protein